MKDKTFLAVVAGGIGFIGTVGVITLTVLGVPQPPTPNYSHSHNQTPVSAQVKGVTTPQPVVSTCTEKEESRICTDCNIATVTYKKVDCSTYSKEASDESCKSLCPLPPPPAPVIIPAPSPQPKPAPQPVVDYCCKHCSTGKACGDTCISRNKTCHVGPGCACDY